MNSKNIYIKSVELLLQIELQRITIFVSVYKNLKQFSSTSLYYSKLYYGSEVWHLPERTSAQNKMIKYASANALRTISNDITIFHTHTQIHKMCKRALPDQMIKLGIFFQSIFDVNSQVT